MVIDKREELVFSAFLRPLLFYLLLTNSLSNSQNRLLFQRGKTLKRSKQEVFSLLLSLVLHSAGL